MDTDKPGIFKSTTKLFLDSVKFGSIFDPHLTEEKVNKTTAIRKKAMFSHMTGKKSMPKNEIDYLKAVAKYIGKISFNHQ